MRKNRIVKGGVNTLSKGGKTTGHIRVVIDNKTEQIFLPLAELIALRNDINNSLSNYMERMEEIKEKVRKEEG